MDAGPMINKCHRHQHPECYGGMELHEPGMASTPNGLEAVSTLRGDESYRPTGDSGDAIPLEPMGDPEARPIDGPWGPTDAPGINCPF